MMAEMKTGTLELSAGVQDRFCSAVHGVVKHRAEAAQKRLSRAMSASRDVTITGRALLTLRAEFRLLLRVADFQVWPSRLSEEFRTAIRSMADGCQSSLESSAIDIDKGMGRLGLFSNLVKKNRINDI